MEGVKPWREDRVLRAGNWAVPLCARKKIDIDAWTDREVKNYLKKFSCEALVARNNENVEERCGKLEFLSSQTSIDLKEPIERISKSHHLINYAIADFASHNIQRNLVKRPEECSFIIPNYGIRNAVRAVEAKVRKKGKTELQRLADLDKKKYGSTAKGENERDSNSDAPGAARRRRRTTVAATGRGNAPSPK